MTVVVRTALVALLLAPMGGLGVKVSAAEDAEDSCLALAITGNNCSGRTDCIVCWWRNQEKTLPKPASNPTANAFCYGPGHEELCNTHKPPSPPPGPGPPKPPPPPPKPSHPYRRARPEKFDPLPHPPNSTSIVRSGYLEMWGLDAINGPTGDKLKTLQTIAQKGYDDVAVAFAKMVPVSDKNGVLRNKMSWFDTSFLNNYTDWNGPEDNWIEKFKNDKELAVGLNPKFRLRVSTGGDQNLWCPQLPSGAGAPGADHKNEDGLTAKAAAEAIAEFCHSYNLDGIDFDLEDMAPTCGASPLKDHAEYLADVLYFLRSNEATSHLILSAAPQINYQEKLGFVNVGHENIFGPALKEGLLDLLFVQIYNTPEKVCVQVDGSKRGFRSEAAEPNWPLHCPAGQKGYRVEDLEFFRYVFPVLQNIVQTEGDGQTKIVLGLPSDPEAANNSYQVWTGLGRDTSRKSYEKLGEVVTKVLEDVKNNDSGSSLFGGVGCWSINKDAGNAKWQFAEATLAPLK